MKYTNENLCLLVFSIMKDPSLFKKDFYFNHTKTAHINNTIKSLFSYNELIADFRDEIIVIYNKTAQGGNYFSNTTSTFINLFIRMCEDNKIEYDLVNFFNN